MAILIGSSDTTGWSTGFTINTDSGAKWVGMQYTAAETGVATSIYYWSNGGGDENIKLALVASDGTVLGVTSPVSNAAGWISGSIAATEVTQGLTYYVMSVSDGSVNGRIGVRHNETTGNFTSTSGTYSSPPASMTLSTDAGNFKQLFYVDGTIGGGEPTLSSATPSGTIGTANTATVGCTTDTEEGTLYAVLSETDNVSTATDSQIKAGQNSTSAAADFADDAAVTDSTPEVEFSGLDPETTYYYAMVQETTEGFSNVLSGSFTTAALTAHIREQLIDKNGDAVASETGITMVVYHSVPTEAAPNPSEVIEGVSSDASGDIDVEIAIGSLEDGDPVWIALVKDGTPPQGTFKKVVPVYE